MTDRIPCAILGSLIFVVSGGARAAEFEITDLRFGIVKRDAATKRDVIEEETMRIPLLPGKVRFGYIYEYDNREPSAVEIEEETTLPEDPKILGGVLRRSDDPRKVFRYHRHEARSMGRFVGWFVFDEGDPTGTYVLRLFVEGALQREIRYEAVQP